MNNADSGEHPLHLHGHWFWVLARGPPGGGEYNQTIPLATHPLIRDTATVNANSYLVLRFAASNPGVWLFHCHIDFHMAAGLILALVYGPAPR